MQEEFKNFSLSNLKPCNQHWDKMSFSKDGRLCSKCSNIIHDFRGKSMKEIAFKHANIEGQVCGIYSRNQLSAPKEAANKRSKWIYANSLALLSLFVPSKSDASPGSEKNKIEIRENYTDTNKKQYISDSSTRTTVEQDSVIIQGIVSVIEESDTIAHPLGGSSIIIQGSNYGTVSDINGRYWLVIPEEYEKIDSLMISFNFIGAESIVKKVPVQSQQVDIQLKVQPYITEFYITQSPLHLRIWHFITRPFRK